MVLPKAIFLPYSTKTLFKGLLSQTLLANWGRTFELWELKTKHSSKSTRNNTLLTFGRLLQPDGVVEFLEFDPRPRTPFVGPCREPIIARKTQPARVADRFIDSDLAENVPGWSARVSEELKATLRPRDGIPAPNLKEWLEGAG